MAVGFDEIRLVSGGYSDIVECLIQRVTGFIIVKSQTLINTGTFLSGFISASLAQP